MATMQAVVANVGSGKLALETVKKPTPVGNQMLCRCLACGICGTDLHTMRFGAADNHWVGFLQGGLDPHKDCVMGHEYVTRIEELGEITSIYFHFGVGVPLTGGAGRNRRGRR